MGNSSQLKAGGHLGASGPSGDPDRGGYGSFADVSRKLMMLLNPSIVRSVLRLNLLRIFWMDLSSADANGLPEAVTRSQ